MSTRSHLFIPDTQVRKGVPTEHIDWIAQYIVDRRPSVIVVAGDWFDMPSMSSHDAPGSMATEGQRYEDDIQAGNEAFDRLCKPLEELQRRLARGHRERYTPELHFLEGNHEFRVMRAVQSSPKLAGTIGMHHMNPARHGFTVHPFLKPVVIDGIAYSHYFPAPMTGRAYGGTAANILSKLRHSFTQGHRQVFDIASSHNQVTGKEAIGLIAGACYLHTEDYKGPQGNAHFRGVIMKHEVQDGAYDIMRVSLDFLARKYQGMRLPDFMMKSYPKADWSHLGSVAA